MNTNQTMFCYQCEQTVNGQACTVVGVCGKDAQVAALQDLLVFELQGIGYFGNLALQRGDRITDEVSRFVLDALFTTLTNVNFDPARLLAFIRRAEQLKQGLSGPAAGELPPAAAYRLPAKDADILEHARRLDIRPQAESDPDIQSLKDTILFGLKGIAAYATHAWVLGYKDEKVTGFIYQALAALTRTDLTIEALLGLALELGQVNLACMELLDTANTVTFGHPQPARAAITARRGPAILVSGHDLADLKMLLEQTAGTGVNVYTHGEMLPAHGYPELKKHPHLAGNFGGAWQNQQHDFEGFPGPILMTTNCLIRPRESYRDRIFTTGVVGWQGVCHVEERAGKKDFTPLIALAQSMGGFPADELETTVMTGFARSAVLSAAGQIVEAVKSGQISHFFLVGGCDGIHPERQYYTDFVRQAPQDSIILTLGCGKYRFYKESLGTVAGLPRLLDMGQCNDAYSAIRVAVALADAFGCSVNELPLTLVLSWFEQKAVSILLTLLSLGIKNIYLGPSLPAFLTPNVLQVLVSQYDLHPTGSPQQDLEVMLQG